MPFESSSVLALAAAAVPEAGLGQGAPAASVSRDERNQRLTTAVSLHFDSVWRMLRRLGVPAADADDAAQTVFLALDKRLLDVPVERERSFLLAAAVRIAANTRRQLKRSREDAGLSDEGVAYEPSPEHALQQRQALAELDVALASMSDEQRSVFVLYEIEGFSLPEITRALSVSVGTATSRLRRAKRRLSVCRVHPPPAIERHERACFRRSFFDNQQSRNPASAGSNASGVISASTNFLDISPPKPSRPSAAVARVPSGPPRWRALPSSAPSVRLPSNR